MAMGALLGRREWKIGSADKKSYRLRMMKILVVIMRMEWIYHCKITHFFECMWTYIQDMSIELQYHMHQHNVLASVILNISHIERWLTFHESLSLEFSVLTCTKYDFRCMVVTAPCKNCSSSWNNIITLLPGLMQDNHCQESYLFLQAKSTLIEWSLSYGFLFLGFSSTTE